MLRAEELRIGNWVLNYKDTPTQILEWSGNEAYLTQGRKAYGIKTSRPIELTEEWLMKFGFEKRDVPYQRRWLLNGFEIEKQGKLFAYVIWDESAPHLTQFRGHSKYVHQLQNLYFVLTGKELTLKTND
jgi:hypothetical protein